MWLASNKVLTNNFLKRDATEENGVQDAPASVSPGEALPQESDVTEQLQGFLNWFLWPLKCKNRWSRLCVSADKDINPSMYTRQICCPRSKGFFLPDPFTASVHDIIPSEGLQFLPQWSCFFQTRGCHSPDMVAVSHPIRLCGCDMALVMGWLTHIGAEAW